MDVEPSEFVKSHGVVHTVWDQAVALSDPITMQRLPVYKCVLIVNCKQCCLLRRATCEVEVFY
jgi:hypothetical protein